MSNDFFIQYLIVKVASRCNLNCSYCYMYNKGDNSFLTQPKVMCREVIDHLLIKGMQHCMEHNLDRFNIVLHGGEPLLAGMELIEYFLKSGRRIFNNTKINLRFVIQTNAVLLTQEWCDLLAKYDVGIGISLDGTKNENDSYRVDHAGRGSYDRVINGLQIALNSKTLKRKPGILSVINVNADPVLTIKHLLSLGVKTVDFLFPDNNYENKPALPLNKQQRASETPYADWLISIYEYCRSLNQIDQPSIRLFYHIYSKFLGATIESDIIGGDENHALVIETDGSIEPVDSLKICGNNFTKGNLNIVTNNLSDAKSSKLAYLYYNSHSILSNTCKKCPIVEFCGGGFIAHRYSGKNGFDNPTIYCKDYVKLITYIQNDLVKELPADFFAADVNLSVITYDEVCSVIDA